MRHQAKARAVLLAAVLLVSGCAVAVDGTARRGPARADPAYFFTGPVAVYGRDVTAADAIRLAYLRALRRVDVCGLVNRDTVGKLGEITWYATLFAFGECDADVKVPGRPEHQYLSVEVVFDRASGPPVFTAAGRAVHESSPGSCDYLLPLDLAALPGAPPLDGPDRPYVRVSVIGGGDCPLARRTTTALAEWLGGRPPPGRDAVASYAVALAERDPCEILGGLADVTRWDVGRGTPYQCLFDVARGPRPVPVRLGLAPKVGNMLIDGRERREVGGTLVYLDRAFCSAASIVGPQLQRRLAAGGYDDPPDTVIVPAVVVDSGGGDCDTVARITADAARLYR